MPVRKTAIAIPESLLVEVDRSARERGESRSRYITRVLEFAVRARRDAEITRKLDELFADPKLRSQHRRDTLPLEPDGSLWDDERW